MSDPEVIVVGSGPNGLAAAITMAREGYRVLVLEAADTYGGGARTSELTLPGFRHDVCSAIHPLAMAGHAVMPLDRSPSASVGIVLALLGHADGWPFPRGGSQRLADAMAAILRSHGGTIETGRRVRSLDELPPARAVLLDVTPAQILRIAGDRLPSFYRRQLRAFRYGPGVCKIDLALDGPVPWSNALCRDTACVHAGGSFDEIADGEARVWRGEHPERPFVLVAQNSLFDDSRAPAGKHVVWAYCHVPNGSTIDMSPRIEAQIERFAPGFRDRILARHVMLPAELERRNENLLGGDIGGGAQTLWQLFARPALRWNPYTTPLPGVYVCSSSTPPGGGVHGMCGHLAARAALSAMEVHARRSAGHRTRRRPAAAPAAASAPAEPGSIGRDATRS